MATAPLPSWPSLAQRGGGAGRGNDVVAPKISADYFVDATERGWQNHLQRY
jgi:hypothetical protein